MFNTEEIQNSKTNRLITQMYTGYILNRKSVVSAENKFLIYSQIIKPIWRYRCIFMLLLQKRKKERAT